MELSDRQKKIIDIVKHHEPISGDKIAEELGLTKPTLRSDLAVLTMTGILDARPKVGYVYSGIAFEPLLHDRLFNTTVSELMSTPVIVYPETTIRDATTSLFMYDCGSLYVIDQETKQLVGIVSRKDLLRSLLNNQDNDLAIAIIMTRMPNLVLATPDMTVLQAGELLVNHEIDSLPVIGDRAAKEVVGKLSKTRIMQHFIQMGSDQ
ncbi:transcriptional repressor CcpN [Vagococcus penaei]|uniref:Transcriptional repressor CcpN n=1 Tax=Vagococcus penaei TaxID=633807 RepID=A0A1Q2D7B3_9ENTE|nr:helix-turn-helix transcriptional regulator [Vagococcus penaei]AQP54237.1 transcriptional repressor CcpN [Vagococcus penaei]RST98238.1 transcriptional repressor CcpN [Vagococcus penaei]